MTDDTAEGGTPAWAASVSAFSSATTNSAVLSSASQLQFPDTSQLGGLCGNLVGGSSFTSGLVASGDPSQGTAGALVGGAQGFADGLCGLMGGTGTNTTPQSVTDGAQQVSDGINGSPMASGTIAMGQNGSPSGNTALDAINGMQSFANSLFNILQGCGCGSSSDPTQATPQGVIDTAQQTADGVNASPMASGIIAMGQDPSSSGNVALDAINGTQSFANALFGILSLCGCGTSTSGHTDRMRQAAGGLLAVSMLDTNPYSPVNVDPQTIIDLAQSTADAVSGNKFAADLLGGGSGNIAIDALGSGRQLVDSVHTAVSGSLATNNSLQDVVAAGGQAINQNTSQHVGHQSSTTAQSVTVTNQNLLVSEDFASPYSVTPDPNGHWSHDATTGDPSTNTLGCLKCVCDGTQDEYVSNEMPVTPTENIEVAATVEWDGLTYTGDSPLIIGVEKFRQMKTPDGSTVFEDIGGVDVAAVPTPGASSSGKFIGIAGVYVVEPGVNQIRLKKKPATNATAGTVRFDNAGFLKLDLIADDAVPGVGLTTDTIVQNLYGAAGSGFTNNDAAVALANTAASLSTVSSKVAALDAEGGTGSIAGDDFNWTGEITANANWGGSYAVVGQSVSYTSGMGSYHANGTDAAWVDGTGLNPKSTATLITGLFDWEGTDPTSTTDYQLVQLVLDSTLGHTNFNTADIRLIGRIASGFASYVELIIANQVQNFNKVQGVYTLNCFAGGTLTKLTSGLCPLPGAGSTISLYLGNKASTIPRNFMALINSGSIFNFTEGGTTSVLGSSNRGYGWGGSAALLNTGWADPPSVSQWLGLDQ